MTTLLSFDSVPPFKVTHVLRVIGFLEGGGADIYSDRSFRKI
jgi:hypothetical protein